MEGHDALDTVCDSAYSMACGIHWIPRSGLVHPRTSPNSIGSAGPAACLREEDCCLTETIEAPIGSVGPLARDNSANLGGLIGG